MFLSFNFLIFSLFPFLYSIPQCFTVMPSQGEVVFSFEGKGVYGFLTKCKGQAASGFTKNLPLFPFGERIFCKNLDTSKTYTGKALKKKKTTDATDEAEDKKNVIDYGKQRKNNKKRKLPPLWNHHKIGVDTDGAGSGYRAYRGLWCDYPYSGRGVSRLQTFEADNADFRDDCFSFRFRCVCRNFDSNYFITHILINTIMAQTFLLGAGKAYDTAKQAVEKNQIIRMEGYGNDRYVVYDIRQTNWGLSYRLINLRTNELGQCDLVRPLSEKFGIGYYYDDANPQFMDDCEVIIRRNEAEQMAEEKRKERQAEKERDEQLNAIGKERLQTLLPADTKAVIIAELHEDESDSMTDYFGYKNVRTVILGFSNHTKDLFSEMRRYAAHFEETAHLATENSEYEHREKYSMGAGYYLGKSIYHGWIVKKEKYYRDRESIINGFALVAGEESNLCIKAQATGTTIISDTETDTKTETETEIVTVTGDWQIVNYSEKALAVFGDTRPIKDELKALGGRFNPKLANGDIRKAGWIFSKSKEVELRNLLNNK